MTDSKRIRNTNCPAGYSLSTNCALLDVQSCNALILSSLKGSHYKAENVCQACISGILCRARAYPQATRARIMAGRLAPRMPKLARARTGKGIPYLVPGCAFRTRGIKVMTFARTTVRMPCHQDIPVQHPWGQLSAVVHTQIACSRQHSAHFIEATEQIILAGFVQGLSISVCCCGLCQVLTAHH